MDELVVAGDRLRKAAIDCQLEDGVEFDDVADAMEMANKLASTFPGDLEHLWESALKAWAAFLEQYSVRCFKRWQDRCANSKEYESMNQLWLDRFEPLWLAGCDLAKTQNIGDKKTSLSEIVSLSSQGLDDTDKGSIKSWANEFLAKLPEALSEMIDNYKNTQRQAVAQTLTELREYDKASPFAKLKRRLFE